MKCAATKLWSVCVYPSTFHTRLFETYARDVRIQLSQRSCLNSWRWNRVFHPNRFVLCVGEWASYLTRRHHSSYVRRNQQRFVHFDCFFSRETLQAKCCPNFYWLRFPSISVYFLGIEWGCSTICDQCEHVADTTTYTWSTQFNFVVSISSAGISSDRFI